MIERPWQARRDCRAAAIKTRRWLGVNSRLREAMVDGAMQRLEDIEARPQLYVYDSAESINAATWRGEAIRGAEIKAESCGFAFIWVSIALKLFEWFVLPKILEWWRNR